jgi:hypothetical protein
MFQKKYTVADMITGYGVAEAVRNYYAIYGGDKGQKKQSTPTIFALSR